MMSSIKLIWMDLPDGIFHLIFGKITSLGDLLRFNVVCVRLHLLFTENYKKLLRLPVPLSILIDEHQSNLKFFEDGSFRFRLSQPTSKRYCGSSYGWLILQDVHSRKVHIINPFVSVHNEILTPCNFDDNQNLLHRSNEHVIFNAVLSANPSELSGFSLMGTCRDGLSLYRQFVFYRFGDLSCSFVKPYVDLLYDNIMYHEGEFYVVYEEGTVEAFDMSTPQPKRTLIKRPSLQTFFGRYPTCYLASLPTELLLVVKIRKEAGLFYIGKFYKFLIFKLDRNGKTWIKLNNCFGYTLIIGLNSVVSVAFPTDFQKSKPNGIYFLEASLGKGLYDLEGGSFKRVENDDPMLKYLEADVVIQLNLQGLII